MEYSREKEQQKYNDLMDKCRVFWAFSAEQFAEGKAKNQSKKYISFGGGGYVPEQHFEQLKSGMKAIAEWAKKAKKDDQEVILYELNNYECFYQGSIEDALPRLKDLGYTVKQVQAIYNKNKSRVEV